MARTVRMRAQIDLALKQWPIFAVVTSMIMLAAAHGFERFGNMPPCALCLHQREAYWAAIGVGVVGAVVSKLRPDPMTARAFALLLACAFGAGAMVAGFHMGVEFKWWPGLPECAGGGTLEIGGDLLGALSKSMDVPSCTDVPWSLFGLSMAGWNMLISLCLMGASILALVFPVGLGQTVKHD